MTTKDYDVDDFFERHRDLGYHELIEAADQAAVAAKQAAYSGKPGSVAARAGGAEEFLSRMREILNFLRFGKKPFNISAREWEICRTITQRFVDRGIMKSEALDPWTAS